MAEGLKLEGVDFGYRRNTPVLRDVTWVPGHRAALLGPNGAGKSTLFSLASGARRPDAGRALVGGQPVTPGDVGWMTQDVAAVPGLRCREQVAMVGWLQGLGRAAAWDAAAEALDAVGLGALVTTPTKALSGGQRRSLGLAEVLVASPRAVLLDEPTVGLDPLQRRDVRALIGRLGDRCQVVVATHLVDDLDVGFDTVTVLARGSIGFDGSVDDFLSLGSGPTNVDRAADAYAQVVAVPASTAA